MEWVVYEDNSPFFFRILRGDLMSNWTEEYLWDRQQAEKRSSEAMKHSPIGKFASALYVYYQHKYNCKER